MHQLTVSSTFVWSSVSYILFHAYTTAVNSVLSSTGAVLRPAWHTCQWGELLCTPTPRPYIYNRSLYIFLGTYTHTCIYHSVKGQSSHSSLFWFITILDAVLSCRECRCLRVASDIPACAADITAPLPEHVSHTGLLQWPSKALRQKTISSPFLNLNKGP